MIETRLKELLNLAAIASTDVASCERYIRELNSTKQTIQRTAGMGLVGIGQVNRVNLLISKLQRRLRRLKGEREFMRRDQIRDVQEKKDDKFLVKPLVDETQARKGYKA